MYKFAIATLFLLFTVAVSIVAGDDQVVNVKGQVICDKRSLRNIKVELREHDTFDPDDSLAETHTDKDGFFHLQGKENEIRTIRPYLRITHNCDVKDRATCTRTTDIEIPQDKIGADKLYDMNFVNLNIRGTNDDEKCT